MEMQIVKLDVQDGKGAIEAVVADVVAANRIEEFFRWAFEAGNARDEMSDLLHDIGNFAHDRSTGPAVPDALWEVRRMAYRE